MTIFTPIEPDPTEPARAIIGNQPSILIVSDTHWRPGQSPPFRTSLEAHAYQHRRTIKSGYGPTYDFAFKGGDIVGSTFIMPPGHDPFVGNPELFARSCDVAASKMSWAGAISSVVLLGDIALDLDPSLAMIKVRAFIADEILPLGLGVDAVIHDPYRNGGSAPPHAHMLISCRSITRTGFGSFIAASKDLATWTRWKRVWAQTVAA